MFAVTQLSEQDVRQAILGCVRTTLPAPSHAWSPNFVAESLLAELVCGSMQEVASSSSSVASSSSSSDGDEGDNICYSAAAAGSELRVFLTASIADLLQRYHEAAAEAADAAAESSTHRRAARASVGSRSKAGSRKGSDSRRSSDADAAAPVAAAGAVAAGLEPLVTDLLYDHFLQIEPGDVSAFCCRLLAELDSLLARAAAAEAEAAGEGGHEGVCALCRRDMPLTKHHLIPRDVHRELKKRGYSHRQLQEELLVCRPCHSAIHRAVPDNRQLALNYSSLAALQQHEGVARFVAWASRQRVSSRADVSATHFKYRR